MVQIIDEISELCSSFALNEKKKFRYPTTLIPKPSTLKP